MATAQIRYKGGYKYQLVEEYSVHVETAPEADVQRAMELAGERFAVLNSEALSEATLVRMSSVGFGPEGEERGALRSLPSSGSSGLEAPGETGEELPASSSAPAREGASVLSNPLV